jgi:adenine-specific DNA-methyltransferase
MNTKMQKLELTWIGKEKRPRLEPRVLVEDAAKSHHAATRRRDGKDIFDNMLIHGDNLLALKALEQEFAGKVKCIYIDPPYNTGNAFEFYDDGLEHSIWLGLMRERLELLHRLLANDGSIWISIDDKEVHYLKVICDEIFGRENFIIQTTIKRGAATGHKAINPTPVQVSDYMLTYAKDKSKWIYHPVYAQRDYDKAYNKYIVNFDCPFQEWHFCSLKEILKKRKCTVEELLKTEADRVVRTAQPDYQAVGEETRRLIDMSKENPDSVLRQQREGFPDIYLKNGERILFYRDKLRMIDGELVTAELVTNLWVDMNYQGIAKEGGVKFPKNKKPEAQIARVLEMSTKQGDLILDSFLGSGTAAAVAHKMGRRWIGVELGEHCNTLCKPRLDRVVDGCDETGVTKKYNWKGGGGYRFYELAPTFITKDQWGQEVINRDYNPAMLAEAVCKLEGYVYSPSQDEYFIHGHATEKAFIYVTTNFMRKKNLAAISERLGEGRHLLICCKAFDKAAAGEFGNLTVRKIPDAVLNKCEWGHDDYSLNVANLPMAKEDEKIEQMELL